MWKPAIQVWKCSLLVHFIIISPQSMRNSLSPMLLSRNNEDALHALSSPHWEGRLCKKKFSHGRCSVSAASEERERERERARARAHANSASRAPCCASAGLIPQCDLADSRTLTRTSFSVGSLLMASFTCTQLVSPDPFALCFLALPIRHRDILMPHPDESPE